jgi:hypothetical protein
MPLHGRASSYVCVAPRRQRRQAHATMQYASTPPTTPRASCICGRCVHGSTALGSDGLCVLGARGNEPCSRMACMHPACSNPAPHGSARHGIRLMANRERHAPFTVVTHHVPHAQNAANESALSCFVDIMIEKDMKQPIYVYYELTGYYQNHRRCAGAMLRACPVHCLVPSCGVAHA